MLIAVIISALITVSSFVWMCVVAFRCKRALKFWEATIMYMGMMYGAIATGLLLSTFVS